MSRLAVGEKLPEFHYQTPFASHVSIVDTVRSVSGKTALVFLRYYGCTLCQYDIHKFSVQYDKIRAAGGQMLIVLQSDPKKLAAELEPDSLPFDIICDPDQELYRRYEIHAASSKAGLVDAKSIAKMVKATSGGFKHGEYEGDELQLPATFVVNQDLTITYAHYGKSVGDVPDAAELAELL